MSKLSEYDALTTLVNTHLKQNGQDTIIFETKENIFENIFNFPISKLLNISSDASFMHECYYKILDRMIDDHTLNYFLTLLKHNTISRVDVIKGLIESEECQRKKTTIIFDQDANT